MSLVPTYVRASDGYWYKNPVIGEAGWFLCYDDNDPIEIVIEKDKHTLDDILGLLKAKGYELKFYGMGHAAQRIFDSSKEFNFRPARSYFVEPVRGVMPVGLLKNSDGNFKQRPRSDCVFYPAIL